MLRAGWVAQELLTTFKDEIGEVAIIPSGGGIFEIRANGDLIWALKSEGRFPEPKEIKQRIRDKIAPTRSLGHADR
tara:strand:- start:678 stop:905 length:228 start_codon:yes stop_codon:yes gene_type:complete